jgi:Tfp pilus assembly protein PilF/S1-C subfamily serine protease
MTEPTNRPSHPDPLPTRHKRIVSEDRAEDSHCSPTLGDAAQKSAGSTVPKSEIPTQPLPSRWRRRTAADLFRDELNIVEKIDRRHRRWRRRWVPACLFGLAAALVVSIAFNYPWKLFSGDRATVTAQHAALNPPEVQDGDSTKDSALSNHADLSALREKVLASLVTIRRDDGRGAGFIIEEGLVVTAYHVLPEGKTATVVFADGEEAKVIEHVACDRMQDIAVLRIDAKREPKPLELASVLPAVGESVACFLPGGGEVSGKVVTSGNSAPSVFVGSREMLYTDLQTVSGWSGSPVMDMDGRVVGITSGGTGALFETTRMRMSTVSGEVPITVLRALLGIERLDKAISLDPSSPKRFLDRADFYRYMGDFDKAMADYSEAIGLNPEFAEAYYSRGRALAARRHFDEAIADFTESIKHGRKTVEVYRIRAAAYETIGQAEKAVADYTEAIQLQPNEAVLTVLYHLRGLMLANNGDHDKAIADLTEALRLEPKNAELYCDRGALYGARKEFKKALADFNDAIDHNPALAKAYFNRGSTYRQLGNESLASADFKKAKDLGYR